MKKKQTKKLIKKTAEEKLYEMNKEKSHIQQNLNMVNVFFIQIKRNTKKYEIKKIKKII